MRPKLKEDPREWRKFALTGGVIASAFCIMLLRRGTIGVFQFRLSLSFLIVLMFLALVRPRTIRPVYRGMMTFSFYSGQIVGRVMLGIFFLLILTPLGIVLRLFGKDPLRLRKDRRAETYWRAASGKDDFNRQF